DQSLGGERRGEGGDDADRQRAAQLGIDATASEARTLEQGGADDHGQGDRAREQVGLVAREAPPARRRQGDAVARYARRESRRLREPDNEAIRCACLPASSQLGLAV